MYYANINSHDELVGIGLSEMIADEYGSSNVQNIEVDDEVFDKFQEYGLNYYKYDNGEIILNPDYEAEQAAKEAERISHLKCTKRVLVLILEQLGLDYFEQIEPLINSNRQAKLEWELCVELERSNPLLDVIGAELGISPKQIDQVFKYANGEVETLAIIED